MNLPCLVCARDLLSIFSGILFHQIFGKTEKNHKKFEEKIVSKHNYEILTLSKSFNNKILEIKIGTNSDISKQPISSRKTSREFLVWRDWYSIICNEFVWFFFLTDLRMFEKYDSDFFLKPSFEIWEIKLRWICLEIRIIWWKKNKGLILSSRTLVTQKVWSFMLGVSLVKKNLSSRQDFWKCKLFI